MNIMLRTINNYQRIRALRTSFVTINKSIGNKESALNPIERSND